MTRSIALDVLFCAFWGSLSPAAGFWHNVRHSKDLCYSTAAACPSLLILSCRDTVWNAFTQNQNYRISWVGRDITKSNSCPCTGYPRNLLCSSELCAKHNRFSDDNSSGSSLIALLKWGWLFPHQPLARFKKITTTYINLYPWTISLEIKGAH